MVLDDGSKDNTLEVLQKFGNDIVLSRHDRTGPIPLLNVGMRAASAPLIAFFDADDRLEPGYFSKLMEPFAWSGCAYSFCDYFECEYGSPRPTTEVRLHGNPYCGTGIGGFMYRQESLLEVRGFDEGLHTPEYYAFPEYDLLMKFEAAGEGFAHIPLPLWTYVRRPSSMSAELRGARMERGKEVLRKRHGWLPEMRSF